MVFEEICEIITEEAGIDSEELSMETSLIRDLEADSLVAVEIVLAIEEKYDIVIPDKIAEKFQTIGDIVEYVEGKIK